jgi:protein TonB
MPAAKDYLVIDLSMPEAENPSVPPTALKKLKPAKIDIPVRSKIEKKEQKVSSETQREMTASVSTPPPPPPAAERQEPAAASPKPEDTVPGPVEQPPQKGAVSDTHRPSPPAGYQTANHPPNRGAHLEKGHLPAGEGRPEDVQEHLRQRYINEHFLYIKKIIQQNLTYPHAAKRAGLSGVVTVTFMVLENGRVDHINILKSSGHSVLDSNAIKTIQDVSPFPKPPVKALLQMPIVYQLE